MIVMESYPRKSFDWYVYLPYDVYDHLMKRLENEIIFHYEDTIVKNYAFVNTVKAFLSFSVIIFTSFVICLLF